MSSTRLMMLVGTEASCLSLFVLLSFFLLLPVSFFLLLASALVACLGVSCESFCLSCVWCESFCLLSFLFVLVFSSHMSWTRLMT